MPIRIKCEQCKKTLSVKDHLAGKKIKCPVCSAIVLVPAVTASRLSADKSKANGTPPNGIAEPIAKPTESIEADAAAALVEATKPVKEEGPPKTIDFVCSWCDTALHFPLDLAGKQTPCTNPECRRIVKVPVPKVAEKKDWRKMNRQGPAAALINQPEQLDNAWGTEVATQARQSSLAQAGVLPDPKREPVGVMGWLRRGVITVAVLAFLVAATLSAFNIRAANQQLQTVKIIKDLIDANELNTKHPVLAAAGYRTKGLYLLHTSDKEPADRGRKELFGAQSLLRGEPSPAIHEQLMLIEIALSQIELGGDDEANEKKLPWEKVRPEIVATLEKIRTPEVRVIALRKVGARLVEVGQVPMAMALVAGMSNPEPDAPQKLPLAYRQYIAFVYWKGDAEAVKALPKPPADDAQSAADGLARVGYAEGHARKGEYDQAFKLAEKGEAADRLDAYLAIASVALADRKNTEATDAIQKALKVLEEPALISTPWQRLQLVQLCACTDNPRTKDLAKMFPQGTFPLRARLEIILAACGNATGPIDAGVLSELEADDKEGTTLPLAWLAWANHNSRHGATRDQNRKVLEERMNLSEPKPSAEVLRAAVDIGSYSGSLKR